jgi:hypothetical protein
MATDKYKYTYPQKYFLESEACRHFGIKQRTLKRLIDDGQIIPGRIKVKKTNYYVIEPIEFHSWFSANILEPATNKNKFHNRKIKSKNSSLGSFTHRNKKTSDVILSNGGLSVTNNGGVVSTAITQGGITT